MWSIDNMSDIPRRVASSTSKAFGFVWQKVSRILLWIFQNIRSARKHISEFTAKYFRQFTSWYNKKVFLRKRIFFLYLQTKRRSRGMWKKIKTTPLIGIGSAIFIAVAIAIVYGVIRLVGFISQATFSSPSLPSWFSSSATLWIIALVIVGIPAIAGIIWAFKKWGNPVGGTSGDGLKTFGKGLLVAGLFHLAVVGLIWVLVPYGERLRNIYSYLTSVPCLFLTIIIIVGGYSFGKTAGGHKLVHKLVAVSTGAMFLFGVVPYFLPDHIRESVSSLWAEKAPSSSERIAQVPKVTYVGSSNPFEKSNKADLLPEEYSKLIDSTFHDQGDSVVAVMKSIAYCESRGKQFSDTNPTVALRGQQNQYDVGLFQINDTIHRDMIAESGENIETAEGNARIARKLYNNRRFNDWGSSRYCWEMGYKTIPPGWPNERTPEQVAAFVEGRDEIIVVDLPRDSSLSEPVPTFSQRTRSKPEKDIRYTVYNEHGDSVMSHTLENGEWVPKVNGKFTTGPKTLRFRSFSPDFVRMTVTRFNHH